MQNDATLIDQVISGDDTALEELHRRHASIAWRFAQGTAADAATAATAVADGFARVFQALRAGRLDREGPFRSYLLTGTRNAALDAARTAPTGPGDSDGSADLVAISFRNLPERWRSMLWLTEVEGMATKDAAVLLGLSASAASQLAARARAGLRERLLQAHLRETTDGACRFTVDRLGAHVSGGLSPRDTSKVDQHLAACDACASQRAELDELASSLARTARPMPLALAAGTTAAVRAALATPMAPGLLPVGGPSVASRAVAWTRTPPSWFQKAVAASSAAVLAVGVASIGFHDVEDVVDEIAIGPKAPARTVPAPVTIDLAGQIAPLTLSSADAVGGAVRRAGTAPARPTVAATDRVDVAAPAIASGPGSVAASPGGSAPGDAPAPPGPLGESPAGELPVPTPPPPVPDPVTVVDQVVDSVASTIATVQETTSEAAPASEPVAEAVATVTEPVPEPVSEPVEAVTGELGL